jgi:hypothetical protein
MAAKLASCLTALDDTSFASLPGRYTLKLSVLFDFARKQVTPSGAKIAPASDHARSFSTYLASRHRGYKLTGIGDAGVTASDGPVCGDDEFNRRRPFP